MHKHPPFRLVGIGLSVWVASAVIAGFSQYLKSYFLLLFARMASGVGEASFQVVAAPFIQVQPHPPTHRSGVVWPGICPVVVLCVIWLVRVPACFGMILGSNGAPCVYVPQDVAGDKQGFWLGLFYTAIPFGTCLVSVVSRCSTVLVL